jgi:putative (di)nucleoside polyphosphate hydrolase
VASRHFRAGVVIVIRNAHGEVMAFERADAPGAWQLPQGGLNEDETVTEAAWRELAEETALTPSDVRLVDAHPHWTVYEWPPELAEERARRKGRDVLGQAHRWVFFDVLGDHVQPTPDGHEFVDWKWVEPRWLVEHVVEFRRPAYRRMLLAS